MNASHHGQLLHVDSAFTASPHLVLDAIQHRRVDPGHDPHAGGHVGGVGQLYAVLGEGTADRPHAERDEVHRAA